MSLSDFWCSPPEIGDPLQDFAGAARGGMVDVDPCSNPRSIIRARIAYEWGGLIRPWGELTYENPPYSQGQAWVDKGLAEIRAGNVCELIRLTMMSTSTYWWRDMCHKHKRNPRILALKRLEFIDPYATEPGKKRVGCRFEPALTYIGPRVREFDKTFGHLTRWSTWGR